MSRLKKTAVCKEELKYETFSGVCQCCIISDNSLKNMLQVFVFDNEENTTYCDMLNSCFSIKVTDCEGSDDKLFLICEKCISRLKDSFAFRNQIEDVQQNLRNNIILLDLDSDVQIKEEVLKIKYERQMDPEVEDDNDFSFDDQDYGSLSMKESKRYTIKKKSSKSRKVVPTKKDKKLQDARRERKLKKNVVLSEKDLELLKELRSERRRHSQRIAHSLPFKLEASTLTCEICKETFPTHKHYKCHLGIHFPNHICDLCGKQFVSKLRLSVHIKQTHDLEKVLCQICNKLLKKSSMRRHTRLHGGDKNIYACQLCEEKFASYSTRVFHMRDVHKCSIVEYKCKMCPKIFDISSKLARHIREFHLKEKNHVCTFCDQAFFSKHSLKLHMVSHTGEKEFQCQVCCKRFGRKRTLTAHMKIHKDTKDHICPVCGRGFTQKCSLQGHMRVHEKSDKSVFLQQ